MPSGRHGLWDHGGASRPPPLPRRRVALPRAAWYGALSAGRSSGFRIIVRLRPSQAPRFDSAEALSGVLWRRTSRLQRRDRAGVTPDFPSPTLSAQYSTDWECFPLEVSSAPVGELKSWKVKEAGVSLQLSNSRTFQLPALSAR